MSTRRASARSQAPVRYRIVPIDPKAHLFEVTLDVMDPDPTGQRLALPAWIPGSYMIREFARHIVTIEARSGGRKVALAKRDKHTWQAKPCDGPLTVRYRVYAWDWSVRAAHLDETHGFFNGTSVFLCALGHEDQAHDVDIVRPAGRAFAAWRVATTLPEHGAPRHGFGLYRAPDYDALIDHPVEMGTFRLERFDAAGTPHEIAYSGAIPHLDAARVNADVAKICAAQIRFFAAPRERAPFDRYVFLTAVAGEGYGGLEHRASTALLCNRDGLPVEGAGSRGERSNGYLTFLGLVSHEYFHSWNVKRIKPAVFAPYDLREENYTSLLWIFEGFTSYYDDLFLVRTGLATDTQYLTTLAKVIDDVLAGPGRRTQSVAESSFDAWTKYYRQDENTPNAVVSYYRKGSLVGLCLDLLIRARTKGRGSLDDAMRLLWRRYGRDFYPTGRDGLGEDEFPAIVLEATGVDVKREVARWAYGTDELPIAQLIAPFGLALRQEPGVGAPTLEARVAGAGGDTRVAAVTLGGAAHAAGLSAGDVLVAIDDLRVPSGKLATLLGRYRVGDVVDVTFFRADVLMKRRVTLAGVAPTTSFVVQERPRAAVRSLRDGWLRGTRR
jgi:predicted metalloprotease with PDZ domain